MDIDIPDIDALVSDRRLFNDFVYTPFSEALIELAKRRQDAALLELISDRLDGDIPEPLLVTARIVLLRYLVTPTYEVLRFLHIASGIDGVRPLLCEYPKDKFMPSNISKKLLGKLTFFNGWDRNGSLKAERAVVIDFEAATNKPMDEIVTVWGESLRSFHHRLFAFIYPHLPLEETYDISRWYSSHGPQASRYYESLLLLFVGYGLLFENFVLHDKDESPFIRDVFLPAFISAYKATGKKPLIVAFQPTDIEGDKYWLCYPPEGKAMIVENLAAKV
jgi:hypothetical protein